LLVTEHFERVSAATFTSRGYPSHPYVALPSDIEFLDEAGLRELAYVVAKRILSDLVDEEPTPRHDASS
jgi:hypothetical protein